MVAVQTRRTETWGRRGFGSVILLAVLAFLGVTAPAAHAQPISPDALHEARAAFLRGVEAAKQEHWEEARAAFALSHQLVPSAVTLLNLAGSQVNSGKLVEGYRNYRLILSSPADAAQHRTEIERVLVQLEPRLPRVRIVVLEISDGDAILLDGQPVVQASAKDDVFVDPGPHRVELTHGGRAFAQRTVDIAEGQQLVVDLDEVCTLCKAGRALVDGRTGLLAADSASEAHGPARRDDDSGAPVPPGPRRTLAWTAFGVGALGLATFAVAGALALKSRQDLSSNACARTSTCTHAQGESTRRLALISDVGLGVTIVGVSAGLVAWFVQNKRPQRAVTVAPDATLRSVGLSTRVTF